MSSYMDARNSVIHSTYLLISSLTCRYVQCPTSFTPGIPVFPHKHNRLKAKPSPHAYHPTPQPGFDWGTFKAFYTLSQTTLQ